MSDDLRSDLTDIDGVGDATANKILDVLADHDTGTEPTGYLAKAVRAAENGQERDAALYLLRWSEE